MPKSVFTVIVADDEDELREAMCRLIDWESIGFRLLGSVGNGLDALQMVEKLQPDLLLTDIQMPFITGTSLARQVRELQPMIQVAFLSGYDDFEYARSAIDNRVIAYLLKPISMAELTESLRTIHERMENRFHEFLPEEQDADLSLAVSSLLLDSFPEQSAEEQRQRLLRSCGMTFGEPYELIVLAAVPESGELPQNAAQIADKTLQRSYSCASFVSGRRILSLLISENGFLRLNETLDELYYLLKRILGTDCALGVSRRFDRLEQCSAACREAVDAARISEGTGIRYTSSQSGMGQLVERTLRMIDQRYMEEELSLNSVSEELHVSPNYLSANMKKYAGDTFINLLIQKRMETAKILIQAKDLKIGEIAGKCGYSDQHYFSFCFKKYYGISPAKMRRGEEEHA